MKKETSNIDKIFRDKLYDYQSNPQQESWQKIVGKLHPNKPVPVSGKRLILYYSIAASTVLFVSAGLFYFIQKEHTNSFSSSEQASTTDKERPKDQEDKKEIEVVVAPKKTNPIVSAITSITFKEEKAEGKKKEIYLPDGSRIVLNRHSKIKYSSNFKEERMVFLYGEAFFEVKPNAGQSFIVEGNLSKTKVLGTSFIIRSYENDAYDEINVISGKVSFGKILEKGNEILILAGNKGTL